MKFPAIVLLEYLLLSSVNAKCICKHDIFTFAFRFFVKILIGYEQLQFYQTQDFLDFLCTYKILLELNKV